MKKQFTKAAALTAAAMAVFGMVIPGASDTAAAAEVTIKNETDEETHSYAAYQVFKGTMSGGTLTGIEWGVGVDGTALLTDLQADDAFVKDGVNAFSSCMSAEDVAEVLSGYASESAEVKAFAQAAGQHLTSVTSGTYAAGKISDLDTGYYLIKDSTAVSGNGAATSFMLNIVDPDADIPLTITTKSAIPTLEKKVYENSYAGQDENSTINGTKYTYGDGYNDVADYSIGDDIKFRLYGTVAENYAEYDTYYYAFHDTLAAGFDYVDADGDGFDVKDITVTVDGATVANTDSTTYFTVAPNGNSFTVVFANLKEISSVDKNSVIVVEYKAKLNASAVIGNDGNENEAYLEYSNNPNEGGDADNDNDGKPDETGETPHDKVVVLTYGLEVTKVDGDTKDALDGVEFKIQNAAGKYLTAANGKVTGAVADADQATVFTTDTDGKFSVEGIEDGEYTLVETKPQEGYNTIADKSITINATTANGQAWNSIASGKPLTELSLSDGTKTADGDTTTGLVTLTVENNKGSVLPSTGGMGTTILYVIGGVLVLGAGITLIVRKRVKNEDAE